MHTVSGSLFGLLGGSAVSTADWGTQFGKGQPVALPWPGHQSGSHIPRGPACALSLRTGWAGLGAMLAQLAGFLGTLPLL